MTHFAHQLRARHPLLGYWVVSDSAAVAERVGGLGYDYVCLDMQHGLLDDAAVRRGLTALDAVGCTGVVRVTGNEPGVIGRVLDAGARGVIVPLVDSAEDAAAAVAACRYPPAGCRSYGPVRSGLRIGPDPRTANEQVACIVMIETSAGLADASAICATPGVDAVYVGPNDLGLALDAAIPAQGRELPGFAPALATVRAAAEAAGIGAGIHCNTGGAAAQALADGFTFASISSDLDHVVIQAGAERQAVLDARPDASG